MSYNPKIYSASKIWHAEKWLKLRDKENFNIISKWINIPCGTQENPTGAKKLSNLQKRQLWTSCAKEVKHADLLVAYTEEGENQRGVLVEIGGALSSETPVYLMGDCASFRVCEHSDVAFVHHPLFHRIVSQDYTLGYYEAVNHWNQTFGIKHALLHRYLASRQKENRKIFL
jgi:nucleoside 2-deoxyribosyltransferase